MPTPRQPEPVCHPERSLKRLRFKRSRRTCISSAPPTLVRGIHSHPATRAGSEEGYLLLAVLLIAVLLLIALAIAAPRMAISIQRDKELEAVHRGEQYKHAIKLYYKKFGTYPTSIDQLLNTDNMRFLRKRYKDPITGKDDWRLIFLGQAKVPPLGFFGEPLTGINGQTGIGTPIAGTAGTPATGMPGTGSSTLGSGAGSSDFGSSSFGSSNGSSSFGSSDFGNSSFGTSTTDTNTTSASGTGNSGSNNSADSSGSSSSGKDAAGFSTDDNSSSGSVGPIVGVGIPVSKPSLITYKKQTHYNQWEFVYNPIEDQMQAAAAALNGGVQSQSGTSSNDDNGFGGLTGTGSGNTDNSGFGNSGNDTFGTNSSAFPSSSGSTNGSSSSNPSSGSNQTQSTPGQSDQNQ